MIRFFRRHQPDPEAPQEPETPPEYPVLSLSSALDSLQAIAEPRVLDLGCAHSGNMEFFARRGCAIETFDLFTWLNDLERERPRQESDPTLMKLAVDRFLDSNNGQTGKPIDLILAWDLLDYLTIGQISELFAGLAPRRRKGTEILAFVSYRGPIPLRPRRFRLLAEDRMAFDVVGSGGQPSPGYKENALMKAIPGLQLDRSHLMRHGLQEFLFADTNGPELPTESFIADAKAPIIKKLRVAEAPV